MQPQEPARPSGRQRPKTPAERAEESFAVQRRLKAESAARRAAAAASPNRKRVTGLSAGSPTGRRRTP
jgi:hypothetical protein